MQCCISPILLTTVIVLLTTYFPTKLFTYCDDHLVYGGACAAYDAEFCSRHVENSVCNKVKNECFCRKDYVAIRENGRVTCKTLLTDLKCRVDRDCVHVNRSSCHPGAGYCSCPGNTIYVPQLHACRNRLDYSRDVICKACQQERGICFLHEQYDQPEEEVRFNPNRIGCVCPGTGRSTRMQSEDWSSGICSGTLVDIGLQCDETVSFCRSRNAVCRHLAENTMHASTVPSSQLWNNLGDEATTEPSFEINPISICQCKEGTVAVYQATLSYTECFPKLPFNASKCHSCSRVNGDCYDLNGDGIGDGCVCPSHRSNSRSRLDASADFCTQLHVTVNCSDGFFSVCYSPHSGEPYEELHSNLLTGTAVAHLVPSTAWPDTNVFETITDKGRADNSGFNPEALVSQGTVHRHFSPTTHDVGGSTKPQKHVATSLSHSCQLIEYKMLQETIMNLPYGRFLQSGGGFGDKSTDSDNFCLHLDLWKDEPQCGVRLYRLGVNVIQYEALLEILVNRSIRTPSQDLQIPIKCIASEPNRPLTKHSRSQTAVVEEFADGEKRAMQSTTVELRVLSSTNKEIDVTTEGTLIRLDALLVDNTGRFKAILVEQCFYTNRSISTENRDKQILFIHNGCPVKPSTSTSIEFSNYQFPSAHVQSELFAAFRLGKLTSVFFRCRLILCTDLNECRQPPCNTAQSNDVASLLMWSQVHSTERSYRQSARSGNVANKTSSPKTLLLTRWAHIEVHSKEVEFTKDNPNNYNAGIGGLVRPQLQQIGLNVMSSFVESSGKSSCPYAVCLHTNQLIWLSIGLILLVLLVGVVLLLVIKRYRFLRNNTNFRSPLRPPHLTSNVYYPSNPVEPPVQSVERSPRHKCAGSITTPYSSQTGIVYRVAAPNDVEPMCYSTVEAPNFAFADRNICSFHSHKHSKINKGHDRPRQDNSTGYLNLTLGRSYAKVSDSHCHSTSANPDEKPLHLEGCSASPLTNRSYWHESSELHCKDLAQVPTDVMYRMHDKGVYDGNGLNITSHPYSPLLKREHPTEIFTSSTNRTKYFLGSNSPKSTLTSSPHLCDLILLNNCTTSHGLTGQQSSTLRPVSNILETKE